MKLISFIRLIFTSHSGISSKRICGVIGWFTGIGVLMYCTFTKTQAPLMIDTFLLCVMGLLGIDSVTSVFRKGNNKTNNDDK